MFLFKRHSRYPRALFEIDFLYIMRVLWSQQITQSEIELDFHSRHCRIPVRKHFTTCYHTTSLNLKPAFSVNNSTENNHSQHASSQTLNI